MNLIYNKDNKSNDGGSTNNPNFSKADILCVSFLYFIY